jgi:hypothetical protein
MSPAADIALPSPVAGRPLADLGHREPDAGLGVVDVPVPVDAPVG